jgi:hypothetical protein
MEDIRYGTFAECGPALLSRGDYIVGKGMVERLDREAGIYRIAFQDGHALIVSSLHTFEVRFA